MAPVVIGTKDGLIGLRGLDDRELPGHAINWIERGDDAWWVLTDRKNLIRHGPAGEGVRVAQLADPVGNCVASIGSQLLVGGAEASLFELDGEQLTRRKDFDEAPGRETWYTPWGGPPDVRSLAVDGDGTIYLNVHVGGVLVQRPGEDSWKATMDINADVHEVIAHPERSGVALVASAQGLGVTMDGGETWTFRSDGMHADYCRAVAVSGDTVYVSAATGSQGRQAAVYRGDLAGGAFTRLDGGLPEWFATNINTGCLAASDDSLVIASPGDAAVWISGDRGDSFEPLETDLPDPTFVAIAV